MSMLTPEMNLRETLDILRATELPALSRFRIGSPCRFVRSIDIAVHIVLPEIIERRLPGLASYLRSTSPRWGRSWRNW